MNLRLNDLEAKDLEKSLNNLVGKYVKQTLRRLEELNNTPVQKEQRKVIIDSLNDYHRELRELLGFDNE